METNDLAKKKKNIKEINNEIKYNVKRELLHSSRFYPIRYICAGVHQSSGLPNTYIHNIHNTIHKHAHIHICIHTMPQPRILQP